jgi:hypothetical protein
MDITLTYENHKWPDVKRPPLEDLVCYIELVIEEKYKLVVFIWPTLGSMRAYTKPKSGNHYGYFINPRVRVVGEHITPGDVGYIHLVEGRFGAGTFAHELQHFMNFWIPVREWELWDDDEKIAYLVGNLTNEFWVKYYDGKEKKG